jgi:hypothetical protein
MRHNFVFPHLLNSPSVCFIRAAFLRRFFLLVFLRRGVKTSRGKVIKGEEILGRENLREISFLPSTSNPFLGLTENKMRS